MPSVCVFVVVVCLFDFFCCKYAPFSLLGVFLFLFFFSFQVSLRVIFTKEWLSEKTGQNFQNVDGRGSAE